MNTTISNTTSDKFKPLLDSFLEALLEAKKLELGIGNKQTALKTLKEFHKILVNDTQDGVCILKDMYYTDLVRLEFIVKSLNDPQFISFHDKIFKSVLDIDKRFPRGVTKLFEELIKGITYFSYQIDPSKPMPIYHRIYACGVGDDFHRQSHHICSKELPREEKKRRKDIIERCYIERLIYDALYKREEVHIPQTWNAETAQDDGHRHRLALTREDFQSCFQDHEINIELGYDGSIPCEVRIQRSVKGRLLYEETYTKFIEITSFGTKQYSEMVECTKHMDGKVYKKVQSFKTKSTYKAANI